MIKHVSWLLAAGIMVSPFARAQSPAAAELPVTSPAVSASAANSRLRQTESIYQQQLRAIHIPLLGRYLTDLQKLANGSTGTAYTQEIARVQAIISQGGVVDLAGAVKTLTDPGDIPMPVPPPAPRASVRALIALTPALARSISPVPAGSSSPDAAAVGEIEWRLEHLPAGSYELVLQYAFTTAGQELPVRVDFAGQKLEMIFKDDHLTAGTSAHRLLRLGRLYLNQDVRGEVLRLRAGDKTAAALLVRQLIIAKAKQDTP